MSELDGMPLGKPTAYPERYSPKLLFPVSRAALRAELGIEGELPFHGFDVWNAYEISWLNPMGKPCVALGRFVVPAFSPQIVESKSLKLYLNSFNQSPFKDAAEVRSTIAGDLARACGTQVEVNLRLPADFGLEVLGELNGESVDELDVPIREYLPRAELLSTFNDMASETLVSHLLKSNCPITGQPDWASVRIEYRGPRIDRESLLRYLVSFRKHGGFHEHCVENIFMDILRHCRPLELSVQANYTRRGGLDISPFRSTVSQQHPEFIRTARQ